MDAKHARMVRDYNSIRAPGDRGAVCHAPFVSLNFEQNGNVTACCYNRKFVLGRYPDHSVAEIWEGAPIRELRAALERADFTKGCQLCLEQLESRNFSGMRSRFFDGLRDPAGPAAALRPRIVEFELSNACNLECIMCSGYFSSSIRRNRERLPPMPNAYDDAFVEQIRPYLTELAWAKFLGGEPFLNPLYFKIWDAIAASGSAVKTVITTNATILSPKIKRLLDRLKPYLVLSIDSLDRANYERIRKNASYDGMRANLDYFIDYARRQARTVDIVVCPIRDNWRDMPDLFRFAQDRTIQIGINTVNWPVEVSLRSLTRPELSEIVAQLAQANPFGSEPDAARATPWERAVFGNNRAAYLSLINQIAAWRDAARA
jgi:MoaA/NifB/PqqE/SkfB family radical SAM enzyme